MGAKMVRAFLNKVAVVATAVVLTTSVAQAQECQWWEYWCQPTDTSTTEIRPSEETAPTEPVSEPLPSEAYSDDPRVPVDFGTPKEEGCTVVAENPPTISYKDASGAWVTAASKCVDSVPVALADGAVKLPIEYPELEDYKGDHYLKPECVTAPSDYPTLKIDQFTLTECPANTFCAGGECKPPQKVEGCWDSDHVGLSNPNAFMAEFLQLNPQIQTPGFTKYLNPYFDAFKPEDSLTNPKLKFWGDNCKGPQFLNEQSCVAASSGLYFSESKQTPVSCPLGTECQLVAITPSLDIKNEAAKDPLQPLKAARCVPKPDACPPPSIDVCPSIPGCQFTKLECPPDPDVCKNIPASDLKKKYPASTIFQANGGGWHVDQCASSVKVYHLFCINGKSDDATTTCPPNTSCTNGLCNGQPAPEPKIIDDKPSDCEDTDVPANNPHGKLELAGLIKLKGVAAAADVCMSPKTVKQFKCDAAKTQGFSEKIYTCSGKNDCCDGACFAPVAAQCSDYTDPVTGKHGVKGISKKGEIFDTTDSCGGPQILLKAACAVKECSGYAFKDPEICPDDKACEGGVCVKKPEPCAASCTELADGVEWIDTTDPICPKKFQKKDCNANGNITSFTCDANGKPALNIIICPDGLCENGKCVPCIDSDPTDNIFAKGEVKSKAGNGPDFCTVDKKLVQVLCLSGALQEKTPMDCPADHSCQDGACVKNPPCTSDAQCADADLCTQESCVAGKCEQTGQKAVPMDMACEKFVCDAATGQIIATPQNLCASPMVCDASKKCTLPDPCAGKILDDGNLCTIDACTEGIVTHTPKCQAPSTCNPNTAICEQPPPDPSQNPGYCQDDLKCDDKDICNGQEKCVTNKCTAGTPVVEGASEPTDLLCFDEDQDKVPNKKDNCPKNYNPKQEDSNQNGKGDICELFLSAGEQFSCASFIDGSLKCWGFNADGSLGMGSTSKMEKPADVVMANLNNKPLTYITALGSGAEHSCAVEQNAKVWCWGDNILLSTSFSIGSMGQPLAGAYPSALPILDPYGSVVAGASKLVGGDYHSCALKAGAVYCWGSSPYGQVGNVGDFKPVLSGVVDVDAGDHHNCAVLESGHVQCWGKSNGQVSPASMPNTSVPVNVMYIPGNPSEPPIKLDNVRRVFAGNAGTYGLLKDSRVMYWDSSKLPYFLASPDGQDFMKDVVTLAAGFQHACAAFKDGHVECWGVNNDGQLGIDTSTKLSNFPVKVTIPDIAGVTQLAAGDYHTCARVGDLTVKCWGKNDYGQLGTPPVDPYSPPKDPYSPPNDPYPIPIDPYSAKDPYGN